MLGVIVSFVYLVSQKLVTFDPNLGFANLTPAHILQQIPLNVRQPNTIYHLIDDTCSCTVLNLAHRNAINKQAKLDGFNVVNISVTDSSALPMLPATPAIFITDDKQKLLYAGPYSTGLDCSANDSLIDTVLGNYRQGYASPTIVSEASGCYCRR